MKACPKSLMHITGQNIPHYFTEHPKPWPERGELGHLLCVGSPAERHQRNQVWKSVIKSWEHLRTKSLIWVFIFKSSTRWTKHVLWSSFEFFWRPVWLLRKCKQEHWPLATLWLTDELSQSALAYKHASVDRPQCVVQVPLYCTQSTLPCYYRNQR